MKPDSGKAAIPDLLLERYRLNEVSPAERADLERRLREDETLRQRLDAIARSDEAIRGTELTSSLARRVQSRAVVEAVAGRPRGVSVGQASRLSARRRGASMGLRRWALPAVVGMTAMLVVVIGLRSGGLRWDSSEDRVKGLRPSLTVFRQTPQGSEALADGVAARRGDVVRLAYQAAGQSYGVIVSMDGRGSVTMHLPATGREAARLRPGDKVLLDQAYELDDAPRWECFYFVTSQQPFAVQPVVEAAKRAAALRRASPPPTLALSPGLGQSTFVLQKEGRP
jgi:hypothetical protein